MPLTEYISNNLQQHLGMLQFNTCIPSERRAIGLQTRFFGGHAWQNFHADTAHVPAEQKKYFCFCLFTMTCADRNMHAYFFEHYPEFQLRTNYPKFGWCGFGVNMEQPRYLLEVPLDNGVNLDDITDEEIHEFVVRQFNTGNGVLNPVTSREFFQTMVNDPDFTANCNVFERLRTQILHQINAG